MNKIEMGKKYKTRCGYPVVIYSTDNGGAYPVHVKAQYPDGHWNVYPTMENGRLSLNRDSDLDLVEVQPRIVREYWLNLYADHSGAGFHKTREEADDQADVHRSACVKVNIDVEYGHGLEGEK